MKRVLLFVAMLLALVAAPLNALAATYIQDNGNMFSQNAKNQATQSIDRLVQRTGKEILVYTVPSLNGQDASAAADNIFRQNRADGVLLFMSRDDRKLEIKVGQDTRQALSTQREAQIRNTILNDFRANNQQGFDKGLIDGVNAINSALPNNGATGSGGLAPATQSGPNWVFIGMLVVIALLVVWVIAGIRRARQQQPYFSYGQQPPAGSGPGYGQPGYGGGPGFGGGGFFSGLMGGLGGALLGNALFDAFRPHDRFNDSSSGMGGGDTGFRGQDWQGDDAGQVSDSGADSGSWGDSGGGGDVGFGGGDSGGGGGGDW
jgi:uncharacterized membrane protein YgcG